MKRVRMKEGSQEAHKKIMAMKTVGLTPDSFQLYFKTGVNTQTNAVIYDAAKMGAVLKLLIEHYQQSASGTRIVSRMQAIIDEVRDDDALAHRPENARRAVLAQMRNLVPEVVLQEFCKNCLVHGHAVTDCPAKVALDKFFKPIKVFKQLWGEKKGIIGGKRQKPFIDAEIDRNVYKAQKKAGADNNHLLADKTKLDQQQQIFTDVDD